MRPRGQFACISIPVFSLEFDYAADDSPQLEFEFPSEEPSHDEVLQTKQEGARVREFVRSLSTTNQDVAHRRYWDDQSQADIARSLNISEAAISKRLRKIVALGQSSLSDLKTIG